MYVPDVLSAFGDWCLTQGSFRSSDLVVGGQTWANVNAGWGTQDTFLIKYDRTGRALWTR